MSEIAQTLLDTAKAAATEQTKKIVASGRVAFVASFGNFLSKEDLTRAAALFDQAAGAKVTQIGGDLKTVREAEDIYNSSLEQLETIGDRYLIVGEAKAGVLIRSFAHQVIAGAVAVAGAVLQAGLGIVLPGVGSLLGAGINTGLVHVVNYFLED